MCNQFVPGNAKKVQRVFIYIYIIAQIEIHYGNGFRRMAYKRPVTFFRFLERRGGLLAFADVAHIT